MLGTTRNWMAVLVGVGALFAVEGSAAAAPGADAAARAPRRVSSTSDAGSKPARKTTAKRDAAGKDRAKDSGDKAGAKASSDKDHPSASGAKAHAKDADRKAHTTASTHALAHRDGKAPKQARECLHAPVELARGFGGEAEPVSLTRCDGRPATLAVERLSILARPASAARPKLPTTPVRHLAHGKEWAPGVKLVEPALTTRLQQVVDHFHAKRIAIVSGYRPASLGSFHQSARALDFKVEGVKNEDLVAYCRTLQDTGCGYYPNSSFVHLDVRPAHTGHVYWIDASGPGESPRYVASWPVKGETTRSLDIPRPDPAAPVDENTHPDATSPQLPPGSSDTKVDATTTAPDEASPVDDAAPQN